MGNAGVGLLSGWVCCERVNGLVIFFCCERGEGAGCRCVCERRL